MTLPPEVAALLSFFSDPSPPLMPIFLCYLSQLSFKNPQELLRLAKEIRQARKKTKEQKSKLFLNFRKAMRSVGLLEIQELVEVIQAIDHVIYQSSEGRQGCDLAARSEKSAVGGPRGGEVLDERNQVGLERVPLVEEPSRLPTKENEDERDLSDSDQRPATFLDAFCSISPPKTNLAQQVAKSIDSGDLPSDYFVEIAAIRLRTLFKMAKDLISKRQEDVELLASKIESAKNSKPILMILLLSVFKLSDRVDFTRFPLKNIGILGSLIALFFIQVWSFIDRKRLLLSLYTFLRYHSLNLFPNLTITVFFFYFCCSLIQCFQSGLQPLKRILNLSNLLFIVVTNMTYCTAHAKQILSSSALPIDKNVEAVFMMLYTTWEIGYQSVDSSLRRYFNQQSKTLFGQKTNVGVSFSQVCETKRGVVFTFLAMNLFIQAMFAKLAGGFGILFLHFSLAFSVQSIKLLSTSVLFLLQMGLNRTISNESSLNLFMMSKVCHLFLGLIFFCYTAYQIYFSGTSLSIVELLAKFVLYSYEIYLVIYELLKLSLIIQKSRNLRVTKFEVQQDCSICYETIKEGIFTGCGHSFHARCLYSWFSAKEWRSLTCPICRFEFL